MSRPLAPKGQDGQALGRSRGGFWTKIHLKSDLDGLPIGFHLIGGEASDSRQFEILLDITPRGDDRQRLRRQNEPRGRPWPRHLPGNPLSFATRNKPKFFPRKLFKGCARIEQTMGKLKRFKRIALRREKTAKNYRSLVAWACGLILIKSVHTA